MTQETVKVGQTYEFLHHYLDHMVEHGYGRPNAPARGERCLVVGIREDGRFVTMRNLTDPGRGEILMPVSALLQYARRVEEAS